MLNHGIVRFAVTGVLSTGLHTLVAVACIRLLALPPAIANGVAFVVATVFSYVANTLWSFSSQIGRRNLFRFLTVSAIGMSLAMFLSGIVDALGGSYWLGIGVVVLIIPPLTYTLHSQWTYRTAKPLR